MLPNALVESKIKEALEQQEINLKTALEGVSFLLV